MKRRTFAKMGMLGLGSTMLACKSQLPLQEGQEQIPEKIKAKRIKIGDTIGLVAPASPFSKEVYERAKETLTYLGFGIREGKNLHARYGYVAGKDALRVEDLHAMFRDPDIAAIWCIRGGYGTTRILGTLDYDLIKKNPKVILGYSDISALLQAIHLKTGLVCFHGPVAGTKMTEYNLTQLERILMTALPHSIPLSASIADVNRKVITPGKCRGELIGGNLSLLASLAGTEYALDATDKLVFIEDIGEKPYRIDRMLTQLLQTAHLQQAKGILLGVFKDCEPGEDDFSLSLMQCFEDRLGSLGIPVYYGFSFGHIEDMCTLPIGVEASFDTQEPALKILEPAVR